MFSDPFLNTLFDMTHKDTNISSDEHGIRLASWYLSHSGDFEDYYTLRNVRSTLQLLNVTHKRAKACPFRGNLKKKQFTYNQMYTWVGYMHMSATEKNIPEEQIVTLMKVISNGMRFYAPFEDDRWMGYASYQF